MMQKKAAIVVNYDPARIIDINARGIAYQADDGTEGFVDFDLCRSQWDEDGWQDRDMVGWQDVFSQLPCIVLYTNPCTRFEFRDSEKRGKKARGYPTPDNEFFQLWCHRGKVGAYTFDLR